MTRTQSNFWTWSVVALVGVIGFTALGWFLRPHTPALSALAAGGPTKEEVKDRKPYSEKPAADPLPAVTQGNPRFDMPEQYWEAWHYSKERNYFYREFKYRAGHYPENEYRHLYGIYLPIAGKKVLVYSPTDREITGCWEGGQYRTLIPLKRTGNLFNIAAADFELAEAPEVRGKGSGPRMAPPPDDFPVLR